MKESIKEGQYCTPREYPKRILQNENLSYPTCGPFSPFLAQSVTKISTLEQGDSMMALNPTIEGREGEIRRI